MNSLNGKVVSTGLTFDDVLLIPQRSEVLPKDVSLKTKLTRQIELNVPIISSAMDTVTESRLAIALAHQGGVGFIHKNMTITEQAEEVRRVKLYQNGMISDPVTLLEDVTLEEANEKCKHYKVSGFPVVDEFGILKGIVTNRDLKYRNNHTLKVSEVMTGRDKLVTAPIGITLDEAKEILMNHRIEKLPLIDENGVLRGLITIKDIDKTMSYPNSCKDEHGRLRCGAAVGIGLDTMERVSALVNAGVDVITVDSAHGHSLGVINTVRQIKEAFPQLQVIGGNIVTPEAAKDLIAAGHLKRKSFLGILTFYAQNHFRIAVTSKHFQYLFVCKSGTCHILAVDLYDAVAGFKANLFRRASGDNLDYGYSVVVEHELYADSAEGAVKLVIHGLQVACRDIG